MEQLRAILAQSSLYSWGLLLIVGVPLLILLLGEWIERQQRRPDGQSSRLAGAIANFRNLVLPLLTLRLILQYIMGMDATLLLVRVVETLFWLVLLYSCISLLTLLVHAPGTVQKGQFELPRVWGELLRMALVIGVGFYVMGALWGAPMDQVFAALGVGSIVIGFALQDTLSSLAAGLLLAFEKPFAIGDWLRYAQFEGQVIEMNWRAVRLRTRERDVVVLPNALMGKDAVVNFTLLDPLHAEVIQVCFAYAHSPNQIKRILLDTCLATPGVVHDPAPHIRVHSYAYDKYAINYEIKLFVLDYLRTEFIRDEILTRVYYAAQRANLTVPYQTMLLYQRSGSDLTKADDFPQRLQQLSALAFFAAYPAPVVEQLARNAAFHQFGAEEWILPAGAFFRGFYIILEGEVRLVLRTSDDPTTAPWREVDRLGAGEFFGELLLLRDQPSPYAIEVTQDLVTLFVQRMPFIEVAETNPRLATAMNHLIEDREKLVRRAIGDATTPRIGPSPLDGLVRNGKVAG